MSKRPGVLIYKEDQEMLKELDCETFFRFLTSLWEFSAALDETGEIIEQDLPFDGMTKGLYKAMKNKIIHDAENYDKSVRENTIKGLISAIKREAQADGRKITSQQARALAEHRYNLFHGNSGQQQSTAVDNGQQAKLSSAELSSNVTPSSDINPPKTQRNLVEPTIEEIINYSQSFNLHVDKENAEAFLQDMKKKKWIYNGIPLTSWQAALYQYMNNR